MRAAEAASNSTNMINTTAGKIQGGLESVHKTKESFQEAVGSAQKAGELVGYIADASVEQAESIEQVNKAIADIGTVTHKNTVEAQESAQISMEMNDQAEQIKTFVGVLTSVVKGQKHANGKAMPMVPGEKDQPSQHRIVEPSRPLLDHEPSSDTGRVH